MLQYNTNVAHKATPLLVRASGIRDMERMSSAQLKFGLGRHSSEVPSRCLMRYQYSLALERLAIADDQAGTP